VVRELLLVTGVKLEISAIVVLFAQTGGVQQFFVVGGNSLISSCVF
jgi:hypothetical protein